MQENEAGLDNRSETTSKLCGELLVLISDIATTIRMFSAYNREAVCSQTSREALMWLSDSLHNLHVLRSGETAKVRKAAQYQKEYWSKQEEDARQASRFNMPGGTPVFDITNGIDLMDRLSHI